MSEFDDGILKEDPEEARKEVEATIALMADTTQFVSKEEHPIRYMFYSIWERFRLVSSSSHSR